MTTFEKVFSPEITPTQDTIDPYSQFKSLLPGYVDLKDLTPSFYEDYTQDLERSIVTCMQSHPEYNEKIQRCLSYFQHNSPFSEFDQIFSELNMKYFPKATEYQQRISIFYSNSEFPQMNDIKEYLRSEEIKTNLSQKGQIDKQESCESSSSKNQNSSSIKIEQQEEYQITDQNAKLYYHENISKEDLKLLLARIFNFFDGTFPKVFNIMLYFPDQLDMFFDCFEEIFINQSYLPSEYVYYIAVMAAAASENLYMYNIFSELFMKFGGNKEWILTGYDTIPEKLKKIWELVWSNLFSTSLNIKHQKDLMKYLLHEGDFQSKLNKNEISQSMLIITYTIYLVTMAKGGGLNDLDQLEFLDNPQLLSINDKIFPKKDQNQQEIPQYNLQKSNKTSYHSSEKKDSILTDKNSFLSIPDDKLLLAEQQDKQLLLSKSSSQQSSSQQQQQQQIDNQKNKSSCKKTNKLLKKQCTIEFGELEQKYQQQQKQQSSNQSSDDNIDFICEQQRKITNSIATQDVINILKQPTRFLDQKKSMENRGFSSEDDMEFCESPRIKNDILHKFGQFSKIYGNSQAKKSKYQLTENEYNWKNNLHEYLSEAGYSKLAKRMNQRLNYVKKMTKSNFGQEQKLNTKQFRDSVWNYVEMVLMYKKHQQRYRQMIVILNKQFRSFLRKLTCSPWELKQSDFNKIPYLFKPYDYIHVVLLAAEAKLFTRLLFGFYAIDQQQQ